MAVAFEMLDRLLPVGSEDVLVLARETLMDLIGAELVR